MWILGKKQKKKHAHLKLLFHHQVLTTQCQMFVHKFSISSVIITHNDRIHIFFFSPVCRTWLSVLFVSLSEFTHMLMDETSEVNYAGVSLPVVYLSSE